MLIYFFVILIVITLVIRLSSNQLNDYLNQLLLGIKDSQNKPPVTLSSTTYSNTTADSLFFYLGLFLVVLGFSLLEIRDPYYFVQDDSLVTEMPGLIYYCRAIFNGEFPEYNPYCLLGSPGWSSGGGGFYPPLYLAYLISVVFCQTEYCTLDVLALMQMVAGYVVMYILCRRLGMSSSISILSTLSFLFSGSLLITGRCWHAFHALSFFLPMITLGVHELAYGKFSWKWVWGEGIAIGMLYHAGFPQAWLLTMLLVGFSFGWLFLWLFINGQTNLRQFLKVIPMLLIGASIIYPVYYQQSQLAKDLQMNSGYGGGLFYQLACIFFPYPLTSVINPNAWGSTFCQYGGHFSYFGTILPVAAFLSILILGSTINFQVMKKVHLKHVWTLTALIAFLLVMDQEGGLWDYLRVLPAGLSNHPFRAFTMFVFFTVLSGGLFLQNFHLYNYRPKLFHEIVTLIGLLLVGYHLFFVRTAFYNYGFRPYPEISLDVKNKVINDSKGQHRIVSFTPERSIDPLYPFSIPHSLPLIYEIPSINGYDPLTENKAPFRAAEKNIKEKPLEALEEYGVRWALVHQRGIKLQHQIVDLYKYIKSTRSLQQNQIPPFLSPMALHFLTSLYDVLPYEATPSRYMACYYALASIQSEKKDVIKEYALPGQEGVVSLIELDSAKPLAFIEVLNISQPLKITYHYNGLDIDIPSELQKTDQQITLNFLDYPHIHLWSNNKEIPHTTDDWGRITAKLPPDTPLLQLRYQPEWLAGFLRGGLILILGLVSQFYIFNTQRNKNDSSNAEVKTSEPSGTSTTT